MSAGHLSASHPIDAERSQLLQRLLDDPEFSKAVAGYTKRDNEHQVPFLAGSNNAGDTIYRDRDFYAAVKGGKVLYDGKPYDPTPFIDVHEAVEGAAIRKLGANYDTDNAQGLPGGHILATEAERHAVDHAGLDWQKYQASLQPWIRTDEKEKVTDPPPDLLTVPYKGTPQDREVEPRVRGGYVREDQGISGPGADEHGAGDDQAYGVGQRAGQPNDQRSAASAAAGTPSQKITRDAFLYLEPKGSEANFAQCSTCKFRVGGALVCALMGGKKVAPLGTCGLYGEGNGVSGILERLTPDEIGYTVRPVRCQNCVFGGSPQCKLYEMLNAQHPQLFALDVAIKPHGCCNANSPK